MAGRRGTERDRERESGPQTMRRIGSVILLLFLALPAAGQVDSTLRTVASLYASGAFAQAELEARRLLESDLPSDSVRLVAEEWVAFSLVAQGKPSLAQRHFTNILRQDPAHTLDPVLTSPKILAVFAEAQASLQGRAREEAPVVVPRARPTLRILIPGWEQLAQGRTTAGILFAGAGILTLGGAITLEFLRADARKEYLAATEPEEIQSAYEKYDRLRKAEVYTFAAFGIVYVASQIDALTADLPVQVSLREGPALGTELTLSVRLP
jgi:hypothetical protein